MLLIGVSIQDVYQTAMGGRLMTFILIHHIALRYYKEVAFFT